MNDIERVVFRPVRVIAWCMVILVLGITSGVWLVIRSQIHSQNVQAEQAQRSAEWVGEKAPPKDKIEVVVHNSKNQCIWIEHVNVNNEPPGEFDFISDGMTVFVRRTCGHVGDYAEAHYRVEAADGTVIDSEYTNWAVDYSDLNQMSEWRTNFHSNARATKIVLWTSNSR